MHHYAVHHHPSRQALPLAAQPPLPGGHSLAAQNMALDWKEYLDMYLFKPYVQAASGLGSGEGAGSAAA